MGGEGEEGGGRTFLGLINVFSSCSPPPFVFFSLLPLFLRRLFDRQEKPVR